MLDAPMQCKRRTRSKRRCSPDEPKSKNARYFISNRGQSNDTTLAEFGSATQIAKSVRHNAYECELQRGSAKPDMDGRHCFCTNPVVSVRAVASEQVCCGLEMGAASARRMRAALTSVAEPAPEVVSDSSPPSPGKTAPFRAILALRRSVPAGFGHPCRLKRLSPCRLRRVNWPNR